MALSTAMAILGSAVIGGGISAASSASAAKKAANAATATAQANNALARELYDKNQTNLSPFMSGGTLANSALLRRLGVVPTAQTAPNVLSSSAGQAPVTRLDNAPGPEQAQGGGSPAAGTWGYTTTPDYQAYLDANPDVAAAAAKSPGDYGDVNGDGQVTPLDFAQGHYAKFGQAEGRTITTTQVPNTIYNASEADLQAMNGQPPASAPEPNFGTAPSLPTLDFSSYQQSPYVDFLLKQGQRNLNARAASGGLLNSGAAVQDALQLGQDLSGKGYQDWFGNNLSIYDRAAGQYNADRAFNATRYDANRAFDYGKYLDTRNYNTGRYDNITNALFNLSGQGLNAAGALANSGQNYVSNVSANNNSAASATGNAALANASNLTGLVGNALNAYGYYLGSKGTGATNPTQYRI